MPCTTRSFLAALLWCSAFAVQAQAPVPTVVPLPAQPLLVDNRAGQDLNFDLVFDNPGDTALTLVGIEATWFDREGHFLGQRRLDRNGDDSTMGIATVPNRALPARGRLVVFNPFQQWPAGVSLGDVRYAATFAAEAEAETIVEARIAPRAWSPGTPLRLPLDGPVFVHDGHDLTSHHRRLDITGGMTTHFGITGNFMRHAHDFVVTDADGRLFRGDGSRPEDWFGYGVPVLATADGVVVGARDGMPDNRKDGPPGFTREALMADLTLFLGNHVVLDHGNGEYSLFAHLRQGSVAVAKGQPIPRGTPIGAMGMSGDAFLVHLHYQLQSGPAFEEGLPAVFERVEFATGDGWTPPARLPVDSGDVVRNSQLP